MNFLNVPQKLYAASKQYIIIIIVGLWVTMFYDILMAMIASYTIGPQLVYMVTGTHKEAVITNATNYLKFDTLFYYVTCVISVLRNVMQGMGDRVTPLIVEIRKTPLFEK